MSNLGAAALVGALIAIAMLVGFLVALD